MKCERCGSNTDTCQCEQANRGIRLEPASVRLMGGRAGLIIEGPVDDPNGRRLEARPPSGGESDSIVAQDGSFVARLSGTLDRGKSAEWRTVKVLMQAMRAKGLRVERIPGARDDLGEDALLMIEGTKTTIQCVSLPLTSTLWAGLTHQGKAEVHGTAQDVVAMVRQALLHKRGKAADAIVVLDMAQIGAVVRPQLARQYRQAYPDPALEFTFKQVWLVGATEHSTILLSGELSA